MPVIFDKFNSSELNWTRSRYSFISEKLVIFLPAGLKVIWRQDHSLESHPIYWRSQGSIPRPLGKRQVVYIQNHVSSY